MRVAWISFFPIEWMPGVPKAFASLPRQHPATWQLVLLEEFKKVPNLKVEVVVVRKQFERSVSFDLDGVSFHCLKVPAGMRTLSLFWWETLLIRRCLKRLQPDLVHAWGAERGAALVASRLPYPYLVTMQGLLGWYLEHLDLGPLAKLEARLENLSLRRATQVTVESTFGVQWLKRHHPHLEVYQAEHAPGRAFSEVHREPQLRPLRFLFVGIGSFRKGTDLLLLALDRLIAELDFQATLVGAMEGEFLQEMQSKTSAALWKRITLHSHLEPAQIAQEMQQATMVVFPTRVDNSPNSVKEAVVAGVPVVASAIGGILDYVIPGKNGLTFRAGDLDGFVEAIRAAVSHPLLGQGKVDQQTLMQMRDYLSAKVMGEGFLAAYQRVLETVRDGPRKAL